MKFNSINLSNNVPDFNNILAEQSTSNLLTMKKFKFNESDYKLLKYNKAKLCSDMENSYGLCRSVIVDENDNVICYSPPKSLTVNSFKKQYPVLDENFIVEELVEGTMINMFYLNSKSGWEIATKGVMGAQTSFYKTSSKRFNTMFNEAFALCGLTYDMFNKTYCYSFVLQHPDNRIVNKCDEPSLKLVGVYHIVTDKDTVINLVDKYNEWDTTFSETGLQLNHRYETEPYEQLTDRYASRHTPNDVLGYVVYNKTTGERMKQRNPNYEQLKALRGNQTKLQFQYLTLRSEGKVTKYLKHFPESASEFLKYRDNVHNFTSTLYINYRNCYVKKAKPLNEYGKQYKTHMYNIHQSYLNELKEKNEYIDFNFVVNYVNKLKPELLMFSLNYHLRNARSKSNSKEGKNDKVEKEKEQE